MVSKLVKEFEQATGTCEEPKALKEIQVSRRLYSALRARLQPIDKPLHDWIAKGHGTEILWQFDDVNIPIVLLDVKVESHTDWLYKYRDGRERGGYRMVNDIVVRQFEDMMEYIDHPENVEEVRVCPSLYQALDNRTKRGQSMTEMKLTRKYGSTIKYQFATCAVPIIEDKSIKPHVMWQVVPKVAPKETKTMDEHKLAQFEAWMLYKKAEAESIDHIKLKPHFYDSIKTYAGHFKDEGYPRYVDGDLWWHLPKQSIDILLVGSTEFSHILAFQAVPKVKEFPVEGVMMEKRSLMPSSEGCMVREERYHTIERDWHSEGNAVILFSLGEGEACERHIVTDGQEAMRVLEEYMETGKITLKDWHRVEEVTFSPVYVSVLKEYASYHKVEHARVVDTTTTNDVTLEDKEGAGKEWTKTNGIDLKATE